MTESLVSMYKSFPRSIRILQGGIMLQSKNFWSAFSSHWTLSEFFFPGFFIAIDSDRVSMYKSCPWSIRILQGGIMLRSNEGRMMVLSPSVGCHTTTTAYFFNLGKQTIMINQQQQFLSQYRFLIIIMFLWLMLCPFC